MATIKDVAQEANVSPSTVSRLLNNGYVKKETKARILKAIEDLNYTPNSKAINLRYGYTRSIGCITPYIASVPNGNIVHGIETTLTKNGFNLILMQVLTIDENTEANCTRLMREKKVDGIILNYPRNIAKADLDEIKNDGLPFIHIDGDPNLGLACIVPNNYRGGYLATEHLIKLGHHRIAHIAGPKNWYSCSERFRGYRDALEHYGIAFDSNLVIPSSLLAINEASWLTSQLLSLPTHPTAVFAVNDNIAIGFMRALSQAGIRVPKDMAVIGFDDIIYSEYLQPSLSTIRLPFFQIGEFAALRLLDMITNKRIDTSATVLPVELIVRESTEGSVGTKER